MKILKRTRMLNTTAILSKVWEDVNINPSYFMFQIKSELGVSDPDELAFTANNLLSGARVFILEHCSIGVIGSNFNDDDLQYFAALAHRGVDFFKKIEEVCNMIIAYPEWMHEV